MPIDWKAASFILSQGVTRRNQSQFNERILALRKAFVQPAKGDWRYLSSISRFPDGNAKKGNGVSREVKEYCERWLFPVRPLPYSLWNGKSGDPNEWYHFSSSAHWVASGQTYDGCPSELRDVDKPYYAVFRDHASAGTKELLRQLLNSKQVSLLEIDALCNSLVEWDGAEPDADEAEDAILDPSIKRAPAPQPMGLAWEETDEGGLEGRGRQAPAAVTTPDESKTFRRLPFAPAGLEPDLRQLRSRLEHVERMRKTGFENPDIVKMFMGEFAASADLPMTGSKDHDDIVEWQIDGAEYTMHVRIDSGTQDRNGEPWVDVVAGPCTRSDCKIRLSKDEFINWAMGLSELPDESITAHAEAGDQTWPFTRNHQPLLQMIWDRLERRLLGRDPYVRAWRGSELAICRRQIGVYLGEGQEPFPPAGPQPGGGSKPAPPHRQNALAQEPNDAGLYYKRASPAGLAEIVSQDAFKVLVGLPEWPADMEFMRTDDEGSTEWTSDPRVLLGSNRRFESNDLGWLPASNPWGDEYWNVSKECWCAIGVDDTILDRK